MIFELLSKNFNKKDPLEVGIKSGKARRGTGSAEKTPATHTRHFQGQDIHGSLPAA